MPFLFSADDRERRAVKTVADRAEEAVCMDSLLEQTGFELSVPPARSVQERLGSARFALLSKPFHRARLGTCSRFTPRVTLGQQLLGLPDASFVVPA